MVSNRPTEGQFKAVSVGEKHVCALTILGEIQCWGADFTGPTIYGTFSEISSGNAFSCALEDDTFVIQCWTYDYVWGIPTELVNNAPSDGPYQSLSCGREHCCAIHRIDEIIKCWGESSDALVITDIPNDGTWIALTSGDDFACAIINSSFSITCWGDPFL